MNRIMSKKQISIWTKVALIGIILPFFSLTFFWQRIRNASGEGPAIAITQNSLLQNQIPIIRDQLQSDNLSSQLYISLNEKLNMLQSYAEKVEFSQKDPLTKDQDLRSIAPKVNDPPFREGLFPGGSHLLVTEEINASNFLQIKFQDNYIQLIAGQDTVNSKGILCLIITSSDKLKTEINWIPTTSSIQKLTIASFKGSFVFLFDQNNNYYSFNIESMNLQPEKLNLTPLD